MKHVYIYTYVRDLLRFIVRKQHFAGFLHSQNVFIIYDIWKIDFENVSNWLKVITKKVKSSKIDISISLSLMRN